MATLWCAGSFPRLTMSIKIDSIRSRMEGARAHTVYGWRAPRENFSCWRLWVFASLFAACTLQGCRQREAPPAQKVHAASAPLPSSFPASTRLSLGDPNVQLQLQLTGESANLPFVALFQNISGGPHTLEAFRA